ncbi:MAG: serine/threonine-protein kinase [Planctomycetes bacterium]|nr:serine/threonine-protein kinase [Planctomycetota bacterium]
MTDDEILDRLLTEFLTEFAAGREPDAAAALPERPDLAGRVREVLEMARDVSPRRRSPSQVPAFAGYEIIRELGRGGMGHVYLARHVKLGRTVALKVLPHRLATSRARERFDREARAVARLEHPLIVPVYDMGEEHGQPYFTMQFVEGRTLAAALASVRDREPASLAGSDFAGTSRELPEPWRGTWWQAAARAALDVAEALAYAHAQGVVHRDVKPSNVMLRRDGFALLFDFGLATIEDEASLTLTHGFVGTPHYASPEQAVGGTDALDARTDVFSLGAALYEALTLQAPFPGPTTTEVLRRIQSWEPELPSKFNSDVPRGLETVVLAALEKDRDKRYASAAAMAEDLRAALDGRAVRAKRVGMLARGLRSVKRGRAITELLVEQQALRAAVVRAERNERLARESAAEARAAQVRADAERDKASQILEFLKGTISAAHPDRDGRDVRVADVLDRAAAAANESFAGRPDVRRAIRRTLVQTFHGLGITDRACEIAQHLHDEAVRDLAADDAELCEIQEMLGSLLSMLGRDAEAIVLLETAAAASAAAVGDDAEATIHIRGNLAQTHAATGHIESGARILRDALERCRRVLGLDHAETLFLAGQLARLECNLGNFDVGIELARQASDGYRRAGGRPSSEAMLATSNYGSLLASARRYAESLAVLDPFCAEADAMLGPGSTIALTAHHSRAASLAELGRLEEALAVQRHIVDAVSGSASIDARSASRFALQLVAILGRLRRWPESEAAARAALCDTSHPGVRDGVSVTDLSTWLGRALIEQGRHDEAETVLLGAWRTLDPQVAERFRARLADAIVGLYESRGRSEEARRFRAAAAPRRPTSGS